MPRVIKEAPRKEKKVVCKSCDRTIGYFKDDVKTKTYNDPWGYSETHEYIICPATGCKQQIILKVT
jgi:hypothetical protein